MLLVRDWMTRTLVTPSPEESVAEALALCREWRVRHIPILEERRLVGIVSDRDLRDASPTLGDPRGRGGSAQGGNSIVLKSLVRGRKVVPYLKLRLNSGLNLPTKG